jgi:hypothetical protein
MVKPQSHHRANPVTGVDAILKWPGGGIFSGGELAITSVAQSAAINFQSFVPELVIGGPPVQIGLLLRLPILLSPPTGTPSLVVGRIATPNVVSGPAAAVQPIVLGTAVPVSLSFDNWVLPKQSAQFGPSRIDFQAWVRNDADGLILPADLAPFVPAGSKWHLAAIPLPPQLPLYFSPGCVKDGTGDDFCTVTQFAISPTAVQLNAAGNVVAAGQQVTVSWQVESAGYPATPNYPGSLNGIRIYNSFTKTSTVIVPPAPANTKMVAGSHTFNVGGLPYGPTVLGGTTIPQPYFEFDWGGANECGVQTASVPTSLLVGGNKMTVTPTGALLAFIYSSYTTTPDDMTSDEQLVATFQIRNIGAAASGQFAVHLDLDDGDQTADQSVQSLGSGDVTTVTWTFADGLSAGSHEITATFESLQAGTQAGPPSEIGLSLF